jgi:hypothetical protein
MVPGSALYNNGAVPNKIYRFGEVYGEDGTALRAFSNPRATIGDVRNKGVVPWIDPVPNWRITQPDFAFRILEINNNATSVRGPGTNARIDAVFLNVVKTKLNDPTMAHLGMCNNPGDYRSSGCTSCHVLYANDRDPEHSAHIAQYGNRGYSFSADRCIPRNDPGHPIKHQLTRAIPSSQCVTCHFHQGSGALGNYYGYVWWDYETDAEKIYSRYGAPRPGGLVGPDFSDERHDLAPTVNPELRGNKFADFHNNTWMYQAVYKRDRKGNLIAQDGGPSGGHSLEERNALRGLPLRPGRAWHGPNLRRDDRPRRNQLQRLPRHHFRQSELDHVQRFGWQQSEEWSDSVRPTPFLRA